MRNDEIQKKINNISENEMNKALIELSGTHFWTAILRYFDSRSGFIESALKTIDPFKEPTQVARNQGALMGLGDLEEAINLLIQQENTKKEEEKSE